MQESPTIAATQLAREKDVTNPADSTMKPISSKGCHFHENLRRTIKAALSIIETIKNVPKSLGLWNVPAALGTLAPTALTNVAGRK